VVGTSNAVDQAPSGMRLLVISAGVFFAYAVLGAATLTVGQFTGLASPVWPAAGIAFAAAYVWGWRVAPAILLGSVLANVSTLLRQELLTSEAFVVAVVIGLGAAAEGVLGGFLVKKAVSPHSPLVNARGIVSFLLLGGPVAAVVSASFATAAQVGSGIVSTDQALSLWITWWVGDSIGVVIFAPLTLMLIPSQLPNWRGRRLKVALPSLVGVCLFLVLFIYVDSQAKSDRDQTLEQLALTATSTLELEVARHQEALEGLSSFFESSDRVDVDEFRSYATASLARFPNLQALSWNPLLTQGELREFEDFQRGVQGISDYQVVQRDDDGELIPVLARDEYVPVGYIEPIVNNKAALGFDINSNATRKQAIDRVRSEGIASSTGPIDLVQESGEQKGMLALVPIRKSNGDFVSGAVEDQEIYGFAVGVYRLGDLLDDSFAESSWDRVDIRLFDVTDGAPSQEIAYRPAKVSATVDETTAQMNSEATGELEVYGRAWRVGIVPTSGALAAQDKGRSLGLAVVGLVGLTLLQAFVLLVTGLEGEARRRASRATREANTDPLVGLQNRRAFLRSLELVRERSTSQGESSVLMYIDLDAFKSVNDRGGHEAGDELLRLVAAALKKNVRDRDVVARLGGDEFAVVLNNCPFDQGIAIAENLVTAVRAVSVPGPQEPLSVGVSMGVVPIKPDDGLDIDELLRQADDASYAAKAQGGGVAVAGNTGTPL